MVDNDDREHYVVDNDDREYKDHNCVCVCLRVRLRVRVGTECPDINASFALKPNGFV